MSPNLDLRPLAVRRDAPMTRLPPRSRHLFTRYVLPGTVLAGLLALVAWSARDSFLPATSVTVVPVLVTRAEVQQTGSPLFQAAGWVEPRPTPVLVTALAEGVVDQLLVVEGQEVKAGQPVARLIDADVKLAVKTAEAELHIRQADHDRTKAALVAAHVRLEQPVHLEAAVAEANAMLAQKETDLADLPYQQKAAETKLALAKSEFQGKSEISKSGAVPAIQLQQARKERDTAAIAMDQLRSREKSLNREITALKAKSAAWQKRLNLKTDEIHEVADCDAHCLAAEAHIQQAQAALDTARLKLERMSVRTPVAGRVLSLVARPGMRLMGMSPGSLHDSSTVVTLYDPASLQVRADVRLEDVGRLQPGQRVRMETPVISGDHLEGKVLFSTSQANIQKNTLEVKVAIESPPAVLKPDMLVQVTFLAPPPAQKENEGTADPMRLLIPKQLVQIDEKGPRVWIADPVSRAARIRSIKIGPASLGDLVEVVEGLTTGDRLIVSGREMLKDGQRIQISGEDPVLGINGIGSSSLKAPRITRNPPDKEKHDHEH